MVGGFEGSIVAVIKDAWHYRVEAYDSRAGYIVAPIDPRYLESWCMHVSGPTDDTRVFITGIMRLI
jgi:hypothetical protein